MSLETLIAANTEALKALTIALAASHVPQGATPAATVAPQQPAAQQPAAAAPKGNGAADGALDYEKDVKPLALRVAKDKGRDTLVAILGKFTVAQANLLKPAQYNDFITACNNALLV